MLRSLVAKLLWALFTIWAVVTLTFFVFNVLPEDPARVIAGPQARPADVARIREQLGLDRPITTRYRLYLEQMFADRVGQSAAIGVTVGTGGKAPPPSRVSLGPISLDLGTSYLLRKPVVDVLGRALPPTLLVGILALAIQVAVGTAAGVIAAHRRHTVFDWGTVALTLVGISAPTFLTGLLLQHVFAYELRVFPLGGYSPEASWAVRAHEAFLPAVTLGLFGAAYYARLVRDEMIVLLKADFIRTARAKGQRDFVILYRHALRNALVPLVTVLGLNMGVLVGGAIVTEKIFRWPGIGYYTVSALQERDGPIIIGVVLLFSTVVVLSNLLVDVSYAALDPRVRRR